MADIKDLSSTASAFIAEVNKLAPKVGIWHSTDAPIQPSDVMRRCDEQARRGLFFLYPCMLEEMANMKDRSRAVYVFIVEVDKLAHGWYLEQYPHIHPSTHPKIAYFSETHR
jgi:hypothetical protein